MLVWNRPSPLTVLRWTANHPNRQNSAVVQLHGGPMYSLYQRLSAHHRLDAAGDTLVATSSSGWKLVIP
eukprot:6479070-Amphidinium_carterae.1